MATAVQQQWRRSKYPLCIPSHSQIPALLTETVLEKPESLTSAHIPRPNSTDGVVSTPWYHAVTGSQNKPSSMESGSGSGTSTDPSFDPMTEGEQETDGSVTAYSLSQQSISPPSVYHKYYSLSEQIEAAKLAAASSLVEHVKTAKATFPYLPDIDDATSTMESFPERYSPTSSLVSLPASNLGSERLSTSEYGHESGRIRTLRRTSRSHRIEAPIKVEAVRPHTPPLPDKDLKHVQAVSQSDPWRRKGYPLYASSADQPASAVAEAANYTKPLLSPSEAVTDNPGRLYRDQLVSAKNISPLPSVNQSETAANASSFLPDSPPVSDTESKIKPVEITAPGGNQEEKLKGAEMWQKKSYPLQAPASSINLRGSPSPPPSPQTRSVDSAKEHAPAIEPAKTVTITAGKKRLRRQIYPLQAPASNANLQGLASLQVSPTKNEPVGEPQNLRGPLKRQKYPLQSPASIINLQQPAASQNPSTRITNEHKIDFPQQTPTRRSYKRQSYPLQIAASIADLRASSTAVSDQVNNVVCVNDVPDYDHGVKHEGSLNKPDRGVAAVNRFIHRTGPSLQIARGTSKPQNSTTATAAGESQAQVEIVDHNVSIPDRHDDWQPRVYKRAQKYPLSSSPPRQGPVTIDNAPDLQDTKAKLPTSTSHVQPQVSTKKTQDGAMLSIPIINEPVTEEKSDTIDERGRQIASKVIGQWRRQVWRRQVYPLHTTHTLSPFARSPTPQPSMESLRDPKPKIFHLPKNIRAMKDSDQVSTYGRTLVVCLDGTGDKFDNDNSNIVHFISALKKDDSQQLTYYQAGIGTYGDGGLSGGVSAAMDMAVGAGLGLHVRDAYHFLMHTYQEGDKICILGFSRGAYTARCVAGMIHKVGLLPARNIQQIPFAYEFYSNDTKEGWKQSADFKKTFSIDVNVHFLGCFDSVASVGFIPRQLPLSTTPINKPRYFRHAMALDERRAKFKICRHQAKKLDEIQNIATPTSAAAHAVHRMMPTYKSQHDAPPQYTEDEDGHLHTQYGKEFHPNVTDEEYSRLVEHEAAFETDVFEVWFLGAHADVGGGAVANDERHKLAQIPLRWMIRQAFECNTGIIFKTKVLAEYGLDVHTLWPKYQRLKAPSHGPPPSLVEKYSETLPPRAIRTNKLVPIDKKENGEDFYHLQNQTDEDWTPEQVEDFYDALSPMNDQLIQAPNWWILEFWPVQYMVPTAPGVVITKVGMNMGRYRAVQDRIPNLHWTVRHRMEQMGYKIGARTAPHIEWRTVV